MPNGVLIGVVNRYRASRMKAAKYNEKLLTRSGAVEYLPGVTEDSLAFNGITDFNIFLVCVFLW